MLRERISDLRLAGHQHFAFHGYEDPRGNRLFTGDANGVSCRIAQKEGADPLQEPRARGTETLRRRHTGALEKRASAPQ